MVKLIKKVAGQSAAKPLKNTIKKLPSYNKPPQPHPIPSAELFPTQKLLCDGRTIFISVPQPDRLMFRVPITPAIYGEGIASHYKPTEFWKSLHKYLLNEAEAEHGVKGKYAGYNLINLHLGDLASTVTIRRCNGGSKPLEIDLNPRKLGPSGFQKLEAILGGPAGYVNLKQLKLAAKLHHLDVAIDIVGIDVSEVVVWHSQCSKTDLWTGDDGKLETLYLVSKGKRQVRRVRIYDRVRAQAAADADSEPLYGDAPVTRIEIVTDHFGHTTPLAKVLSLQDRFLRMRAGFWMSQKPGQHLQLERYLANRRTMGSDRSVDLLGVARNFEMLRTAKLKALRDVETVPQPDLITKKVSWAGWTKGLELTGLQAFLDF